MFAVAEKLDLAIAARRLNDRKAAREAIQAADRFMVEYARRHMVRGEKDKWARYFINRASHRYLAAVPLILKRAERGR